MQSLTTIILFIFGIALTIFVGLLKDEVAAWLPRLTDAVLRMSVQRAPEELREQYAEEWQAHLLEFPGKLSQLHQAFGLLYSTGELGRKRALLKTLYWFATISIWYVRFCMCFVGPSTLIYYLLISREYSIEFWLLLFAVYIANICAYPYSVGRMKRFAMLSREKLLKL